MRRAWPAVLLLAACSPHPATLVVEVDTTKATGTRCLKVVMRDAVTLAEVPSAALHKRDLVRVLFGKTGVGTDVVVYAMGYADDACTQALSPPERSENQDVAFKSGRQQTVKLTLIPRPNAVDADHDGYFTVESGGDDCDDGDPTVHPGAAEACGNGKDDDCNHQIDCAQPECEHAACGPKTGSTCGGGVCQETECLDGLDNDGDGKTDCADSDCDALACAGGGTCSSGACRGASSEKGLCTDGIDNDGDGKVDCADGDCLQASCDRDACSQGAHCSSAGLCEGGSMIQCTSPPSVCFQATGVCDHDAGGCLYLPAAGKSCDDGDRCTGPDLCSATGTCAGQARTCTPATACLKSVGCSQDAGCLFTANPTGTCDDLDPCTDGDGCLSDGGCSGTPKQCPAPSECVASTGCGADGGCQFSPRALDSPCNADAGICNAAGACVPSFPYRPTHFVESQLPTPPAGLVQLDCTATITVDTKGAGAAPTFTGWCPGRALPGIAALPLPGGSEALLLSFESLVVGSGVTLTFTGPRPVILAATGSVNVLGTVLGRSGQAGCAGTGAGATGTGKQGGGGGGYGAVGGNGNGGPAGGVANGNLELIPLRGGCPGGGVTGGGPGGIAGGGLQISAAGNLTIGGHVAAPGGKGLGGPATNHGAGGGGSGGAVLLESILITLGPTASVTANGGSGGEGSNIFDGNDGHDGQLDGNPAPGGGGATTGGNGGQGGARDAGAGNGNDAITIEGGGGAGGAVGRIRFNAAKGCDLGSATTVVSPVATANRSDAGCD